MFISDSYMYNFGWIPHTFWGLTPPDSPPYFAHWTDECHIVDDSDCSFDLARDVNRFNDEQFSATKMRCFHGEIFAYVVLRQTPSHFRLILSIGLT